MKAPRTSSKCLTIHSDTLLVTFAFHFNLRRYNEDEDGASRSDDEPVSPLPAGRSTGRDSPPGPAAAAAAAAPPGSPFDKFHESFGKSKARALNESFGTSGGGSVGHVAGIDQSELDAAMEVVGRVPQIRGVLEVYLRCIRGIPVASNLPYYALTF